MNRLKLLSLRITLLFPLLIMMLFAFWIPDVKATSWVQQAERPLGLIYSSMEYYNGMLFSIGGRNAKGVGGDSGGRYNDVYVFFIENDSWVQVASTPNPADASSSCVIGDYIYVARGYPSSTNTWRYNISSNQWTWDLAPCPQRWDAGGLSHNDLFWLIGGSTGDSNNALKTIYFYNPANNSWLQKTSSTYNHSKTAVSLHNDKIYVFTSCWFDVHRHVEVYNITYNTWHTLNDAPVKFSQATKRSVNGSIYLFDHGNETLWKYSLADDTYSQVSGSYLNSYGHSQLSLVEAEIGFYTYIYTFPTLQGVEDPYDIPIFSWALLTGNPPSITSQWVALATPYAFAAISLMSLAFVIGIGLVFLNLEDLSALPYVVIVGLGIIICLFISLPILNAFQGL